MEELINAARNMERLTRWSESTVPTPWALGVSGDAVMVGDATGEILFLDPSGECDPAFWAALVAAFNDLIDAVRALPSSHAASAAGEG